MVSISAGSSFPGEELSFDRGNVVLINFGGNEIGLFRCGDTIDGGIWQLKVRNVCSVF